MNNHQANVDDVSHLVASLRKMPAALRPSPRHALSHETGSTLHPVLLAALGDEDAYIREAVAHALADYSSVDEIALLRVLPGILLNDSEASVRAAVASVLALVPGSEPDLRAALNDAAGDVRGAAVMALCERRADGVLEILSDILCRDTDPEVRRIAAVMLNGCRDEEGIRALRHAFSDADEAVRVAAVYSLANSDVKDENAPILGDLVRMLADPASAVRCRAADALRYTNTDVAPSLVIALQDKEADVREAVLFALSTLDAPESVGAITACLRDDPCASVRAAAACALGDLHCGDSESALVVALCDGATDVRSSAARALGELRAAPAQLRLRALCDALQDKDAEMQKAAASALASLLRRESWEGRALKDGDHVLTCLRAARTLPDSSVREDVVAALGALEDPSVLPDLQNSLEDVEPEVRREAIKAISQIDAAAARAQIPALLLDPDFHVQYAAAESIQLSEDEPIPAEIEQAMLSPRTSSTIKGLLAKALALRGQADAVPLLLAGLGDEDNFEREMYLDALIDLPDSRALASLHALLQASDDGLVAAAALALAAIGEDGSINALQRRLPDVSPYARKRIIWALSFFALDKVQASLIAGLNDEDASVSVVAADALASVCGPRALDRLLNTFPSEDEGPGGRLRQAIEALRPGEEQGGLIQRCLAWAGRLGRKEAPKSACRSIRLGSVEYE